MKPNLIIFGLVLILFTIVYFAFKNFNENNSQRVITAGKKILSHEELIAQLLDNPNEFILKYVSIPYDYGYGSNLIPLVISSLITKGDLLELGMGLFSTTVLHRVSSDLGKDLVSIDTYSDWVNKFVLYNSTKYHKMYVMNNFDNVEKRLSLGNKKWGMVLVDHANATQRTFDAKNYANKAEIVLIHDAEKTVEHGYKYEENKIREPFRYFCKFSVFSRSDKSSYVSTLMLSKTVDFKLMETILNKAKTDYGHISCDHINF
ncbi:unnamed protein product [Brachionus calyciflorus]|uniref:Uncharacterized protein n=1 Tax=Brachionus calyciflorus TaxID=104777 RepID=A0A814FUH6_9BILA|nr:unnamed protein product [Brachionus calyciflorus]